jgi:protein phosphatase
MTRTLSYRLAAETHIGMVRSGNEDSVGVPQISGFDAAFVVADGMGGLRAGDLASAETVRVVELALREGSRTPGVSLPALLNEAVRRANDAVNSLPRPVFLPETSDAPTVREGASTGSAGREASTVGLMGTTVVAGVVQDGVLTLAHAGDSRAYRVRGDVLERLTDDHSFVAERVRSGDMTEAEARRSRFRNMITRAVGIDTTVQPEVRQIPLEAGDTILVCTDGLTTMVEDDALADLLTSPRVQRQPVEQTVRLLIDAANRRGGTDNVTVVILRAYGAAEKLPPQAALPDAPTRRDPVATIQEDALRTTSRRRPRAINPLFLVLLGLTALVVGLLLALSPSMRTRVLTNLRGVDGAPGPSASAPPLANIAYESPQEFAPEVLVRGDLFHYVPGQGFYAGTNSVGNIVRIGKDGRLRDERPVLTGLSYRVPPSGDALRAQVFLAVDAQGNVYVSSTARKVIEKYSPAGKRLWKSGLLERPEGIAVDEEGAIYVVDADHIKRFAVKRPAAGSGAVRP